MHPRRLRRRPAAGPHPIGKFVVAVVHPRVAPADAARALAARLADELPPRRLLVASFDQPLWERALGFDGMAQAIEPLPVWWPDDPAYWTTPSQPRIATTLTELSLHAEHLHSTLGWHTTLHLVARTHRHAELVLAICPPERRVPCVGGRVEPLRVPRR